MMYHQVLGIDPGLANTGYAFVEKVQGTNHKRLSSTAQEVTLPSKYSYSVSARGVIKTRSDHTESSRFYKIFRELTDILAASDLKKCRAVAIEEVFWGSNVTSALTTAGVIAVCQCIAYVHDLSVIKLTPQAVKRAVGQGGSDKQSVQRHVKMLTGEIIKPHHITDAVAVAIAGILQPKRESL